MRVVRAAAAAALLCAGLSTGLTACSGGGAGSGSSAATESTGTKGSGQIPATSQDVSFMVDGTKTYGTLEIPAHRSGQAMKLATMFYNSGNYGLPLVTLAFGHEAAAVQVGASSTTRRAGGDSRPRRTATTSRTPSGTPAGTVSRCTIQRSSERATTPRAMR